MSCWSPNGRKMFLPIATCDVCIFRIFSTARTCDVTVFLEFFRLRATCDVCAHLGHSSYFLSSVNISTAYLYACHDLLDLPDANDPLYDTVLLFVATAPVIALFPGISESCTRLETIPSVTRLDIVHDAASFPLSDRLGLPVLLDPRDVADKSFRGLYRPSSCLKYM